MIYYSPKVTFSSPSNGPRRCRVVCLSSFPQIFICLCYTGRLKLSVKVSNTIFDKALPHCRPSVPAWLERPPFTAGQLSTPQTLSHSVSINPCTAMSLRTTSQNLKPITVSVFFFFALACERIFIKTHSFESRCYGRGKSTVCRRVRASFSPEIWQARAVKVFFFFFFFFFAVPVLILIFKGKKHKNTHQKQQNKTKQKRNNSKNKGLTVLKNDFIPPKSVFRDSFWKEGLL